MQSAIKLNFSNTFSYFHLIDYTFAAPITLIDLVFSNTLEEIAVDLQFRRDNTTRRSIRCRWFRFYVWDAQIWEYSVAYQLNRFRCYCQLSCVTSAPLEISKQTSSAKEKGEDCPGEMRTELVNKIPEILRFEESVSRSKSASPGVQHSRRRIW